jgi:hypothetical protein
MGAYPPAYRFVPAESSSFPALTISDCGAARSDRLQAADYKYPANARLPAADSARHVGGPTVRHTPISHSADANAASAAR